MNEYITIPHELPSLAVIKEPSLVRTRSGKTMYVTEGQCTSALLRTCPKCGAEMHVHGAKAVLLRDLELLRHVHKVKVWLKRMRCPRCRLTRMQHAPMKLSGHMMTVRLGRRILTRLTGGATITAVAREPDVHPNIVYKVDKARLARARETRTIPYARHIGIDEFLLHKGHHYATVVVDLDRRCAIWVQEGKKKQQVYNFISDMGKEWMGHVRAVSMDMNANYESAFCEQAPHVKVVFDHFHMTRMYKDLVLTALRRRMQNECLAAKDEAGYKLYKGCRYALLKRRDRLEADELRRQKNNALVSSYEMKGLQPPPGLRRMRVGRMDDLDSLLSVNKDLQVAYLLGEQFELAYGMDCLHKMKEGLNDWAKLARQSGVPEILSFLKTLLRHKEGIFNHVRFPISNGVVEGLNNRIKAMRRQAYGFRDTQYFFDKILYASTIKPVPYKSHTIL